jgi:hypothetical protein
MAQLVARLHGMQEVEGSNPSGSTKKQPELAIFEFIAARAQSPTTGSAHSRARASFKSHPILTVFCFARIYALMFVLR